MRCPKCGGTLIRNAHRGYPHASCINCGHDPAIERRAPTRERPATRKRAMLTVVDERNLRALVEGAG